VFAGRKAQPITLTLCDDALHDHRVTLFVAGLHILS
jgi:hypothetical protein